MIREWSVQPTAKYPDVVVDNVIIRDSKAVSLISIA